VLRKILIAVALASTLGAAQARSTVPLLEPSRVDLASVSTPLTNDKVKSAIIKGGARHGWTIQTDAPGKLTLKFDKENKHQVVVDVSYDATGFQIAYVSSVNMKYGQDKGIPMIHPYYNKWVANLSSAISAEALGAPAD
jgi:hypothetical protein